MNTEVFFPLLRELELTVASSQNWTETSTIRKIRAQMISEFLKICPQKYNEDSLKFSMIKYYTIQERKMFIYRSFIHFFFFFNVDLLVQKLFLTGNWFVNRWPIFPSVIKLKNSTLLTITSDLPACFLFYLTNIVLLTVFDVQPPHQFCR